jgi:hypothetical protein
MAAGALERRDDLAGLKAGRAGRVRGGGQQLQRVGGGQVVKCRHRGGKELQQRRPQPQHLPATVPDQPLVGASQDLDRLSQSAVCSDRAQLVAVGTDHVGECVRILSVALGPRGVMPLPVAGDLQRVDREHLVAGGDQRLPPSAPVGLDPNHHLLGRCVLGQEPADQPVQLRDPGAPFRQPSPAQPPPGLVLDFDIVMILGPVVPDQQQRSSSPPRRFHQPGEHHQRPNGQVLTNSGTSSHQRSTLPTSRTGARSVCRTQPASRPCECSPTRRLRAPSLPQDPNRRVPLGSAPLGVCRIRGQSSATQRSIAAWSRSAARRVGRCTLQPSRWCSSAHTCAG